MSLNLRKPVLLLAVLAFNAKRTNNFSNNTGCSSNSDVFMAHGTVLIQNQPVFYASFTKELIAIITFFCISGDLYSDYIMIFTEANLAL
jgi:hypothetical protein